MATAFKKKNRSMNEDEVKVRMQNLMKIIDEEAQKEIQMIDAQSTGNFMELVQELTAEPIDTIDDWVEKLRAFCERQTIIICAKHKRAAKMKILEAFGALKDEFKEESRNLIEARITGRSSVSGKVFHDMIYEAVVLLMEPVVVVHVRSSDVKRAEKQYESVIKRYAAATQAPLNILTSKHCLKEKHFGRILVTNKDASVFVDSDLRIAMERVADDVFAADSRIRPNLSQNFDFGMEALRAKGLQIMPRSPRITQARLEILLGDMRNRDPKNHPPVIQLIEDIKKEQAMEKARYEVEMSPKRRVRLQEAQRRQSMAAAPKYGYHQPEQFDSEPKKRTDLYNFEVSSSSELLIQGSSKPQLQKKDDAMGNEPSKTVMSMKEESTTSHHSNRSGQNKSGSGSIQGHSSTFDSRKLENKRKDDNH